MNAQPPPRAQGLSRFIVRLGGVTSAAALARAEQNVEALKEPARRELASQTECLRAWVSLLEGRPPDAVLAEVHRLANELAASAGVFDLASVGQAAKSLCDTLDAMAMSGVFDLPSIEVHTQSILKLWDENLPEDARRHLLERLARVWARAVSHAAPASAEH